MNTRKKLSELAKTIRSKNAGTDKITFDIIFREKETYELVKRSRSLTRESVCDVLNVDPARLTDFVEYDPAYAIKFTILRNRPSGSAGDGDVFGAQQYAPFLDLEVDLSS
ncbi:MAG: acyl-CoA synthetase [Rhodobacterales bacterium 32-67-9]|nr:MAG: acyl-CoA synthetase [Rhodobacterales bacterium 32-67-9]